jgi:nicotinate-nucleotide adenylyltransferase
MRLGILGGTFDPIHRGHLLIAKAAQERASLGRVLFIPARRPWMKTDQEIAAGTHRKAMVDLAVVSDPTFFSTEVELHRSGESFSVNTLEQLAKENGSCVDLYFIMGTDALANFPQWRCPEKILALCRLIVVERPGFPKYDPVVLEPFLATSTDRVIVIKDLMSDISSRDIRQRVIEGRSIRCRVPELVEGYIRENNLYKWDGYVRK